MLGPGRLEVIKQEMERVNIDILGLSELKWTGMSEFNSDDQCIYYCGKESLRRNGLALIPSPGDLPDPGIKPRSPALWADCLLSESPGKPNILY